MSVVATPRTARFDGIGDGGAVLFDALACVLGSAVPAAGAAAILDRHRLEKLARGLHYRLGTLADRAAAEACRAQLAALSEDSALLLLRAPALCEAVRLEDQAGRLPALIAAAQALDGCRPHEGWCPLGATWLGRTPAPPAPPAARLACGLPLDRSLPARIENPGAGLRAPAIPGAAATADGIARIDAAVELLALLEPAAHALLTGLAGNVVLRADPARATECWGATSGIAIGRVVIVNPWAGSTAFLAEALLHETVHAALDCAELAAPLLRPGADAAATVPSPWSGNPLSSHAFVHACLVWAVLLGFWEGHRGRFGPTAEADTRSGYIRRGFAALAADPPPAVAGLAPAATALTVLARAAAA